MIVPSNSAHAVDLPVEEHQYPPSYTPFDIVHAPLPSDASITPTLRTRSEGDGSPREFDKAAEAAISVREIMRTPSPTPSEARILERKTRMFNPKKTFNPKRYMNRRGAVTVSVAVAIIVFIGCFLGFQHKIEDKLRPLATKLQDMPAGWVIPIAIMFVMSFPPLFGHEIIAVLCGDIWGVWIGFGIVAAGTVLGELGNLYAFKWLCKARAEKMEQQRLKFALYAQVVREGGLKTPIIMRFSIIPSHFTTAVFATCGMNVIVFTISAIVSLPKQLALVYVGVQQDSAEVDGSTNNGKGLKAGVILLTIAVTVAAMMYINKRMDEVKHRVVYARRKARQAKMLAAADREAALRQGKDLVDVPGAPTAPDTGPAKRPSSDNPYAHSPHPVSFRPVAVATSTAVELDHDMGAAVRPRSPGVVRPATPERARGGRDSHARMGPAVDMLEMGRASVSGGSRGARVPPPNY